MGSPSLGRDAVLSQLARILASPRFVKAERLSRFLSFVVEQSQSGRGDQLKEYVIGVEVYGRSESYDPRVDAIVRVEAGRLRTKLEQYYDREGRRDSIVISLPKGSYAPTIIGRELVGTRETPAGSGGWGAVALLKRRIGLALLSVLVIGASTIYWSRRERAGTVRSVSIVVLPLENLSSDPEQEYFSEGMSDLLTTDLAKIRALRVISRTSAQAYRRAKTPLREIARELGVDYVVEGTVQRAGQRVRITAQLIALPAERHVWAESYERDLRDILALQQEVASVIARQVRVRLTPEDHARLASARRVNHEAYQAYLKGRYYQEKRTADGLKKAIGYFREAIAKDPGNGLAYSGLADSHTYLVNHGYLRPHEGGPQAKAMAMRALEIDGTLAEAHTSLAYILMVYDWDWTGAESEFRRSIDLDPGYAKTHSLYACYFTLQGQFDQAVGEMRRALEVDPLSIYDNTNLGRHLYLARRYSDAVDQFRKTLDMDSGSPHARWGLGEALSQQGLYAEAIAEFQKAISLAGPTPDILTGLALAYARSGKIRETYSILDQLLTLAHREYVSSYDIAIVYAALGNRTQALASLDKAYQDRDGYLWIWLTVDPRLDSLRPDPRFRAMLDTLRLPH
ncbi:MAG TPA: tetratricopeptide repeat protein [Candidatus Acidoferrales bacterium]|nr:tetratricopeptide repeat protein [Candidatus Acidoferrales bacterium]